MVSAADRRKRKGTVATAPATGVTSGTKTAPVRFNAKTTLTHAQELQGLFTYDEMARTVVLNREIPAVGEPGSPRSIEPRHLSDDDADALQDWVQHAGLRRLGKDAIKQAIGLVAREHAFHPVRDYLDALRWDRVTRLSKWLPAYFGTELNPYS